MDLPREGSFDQSRILYRSRITHLNDSEVLDLIRRRDGAGKGQAEKSKDREELKSHCVFRDGRFDARTDKLMCLRLKSQDEKPGDTSTFIPSARLTIK